MQLISNGNLEHCEKRFEEEISYKIVIIYSRENFSIKYNVEQKSKD